MTLVADLTKGTLALAGAVFLISNKVRTVKDGSRKSSEVIRSIPDNLPYDPQTFPKGLWDVTAIEYQNINGKRMFDFNTYGPVKIRTNAFRMVNVWELDTDGDYVAETDKRIKDTGYLLHYSTSSTTLGCIRFSTAKDAEIVAQTIKSALDNGENVQLEVV